MKNRQVKKLKKQIKKLKTRSKRNANYCERLLARVNHAADERQVINKAISCTLQFNPGGAQELESRVQELESALIKTKLGSEAAKTV